MASLPWARYRQTRPSRSPPYPAARSSSGNAATGRSSDRPSRSAGTADQSGPPMNAISPCPRIRTKRNARPGRRPMCSHSSPRRWPPRTPPGRRAAPCLVGTRRSRHGRRSTAEANASLPGRQLSLMRSDAETAGCTVQGAKGQVGRQDDVHQGAGARNRAGGGQPGSPFAAARPARLPSVSARPRSAASSRGNMPEHRTGRAMRSS